MYSIKHNTIYRQGEKIAEITANGLVVFYNADFEKYRLPVWNFLNEQRRITKIDNGQDLAIYFENMEEKIENTPTKTIIEKELATEQNNLNIHTV